MKCPEGHYFCNDRQKCMPIPKGHKVLDDGTLVKEGWSSKYKKSIDCNNPKGFSQKAHCQGRKKKMDEESNPRIPRKKGQPANSKKHSDLYTDENPKGTIHGLGFKDTATAKASVAKIRQSDRKHAHKIQAAIAMEQRAKVMGKTSAAAIFRKYINSMKEKTKAMKEETVNEVAPPGWGHTKAEKEKTKPNKPKSKIGGTAAAFKRALDDGRFKGLPGSTTKKEKTADMFKLMYSMKKKGAKPHYKPGTDKKYKKYQEQDEYETLKRKIGSKEKHDKPVRLKSFREFVENI